MTTKNTPVFFLGGQDLEMQTIRELLIRECGEQRVIDKKLAWGAKLSHYAEEIERIAGEGHHAVAVELADDMQAEWGARSSLTLVDHHGDRASEPPSLRQVFDLLQLPDAAWTRDFSLVAANDYGHVRAMKEFGATREEMLDIRKRDRSAQGISPEEDVLGLQALDAAETAAAERLLVVRLPHGRTATAMDPLVLDARFAHLPKEAVVVSPTSVMFFGRRAIVDLLRSEFTSGFSGGAGPDGFFGLSPSTPEMAESVVRLATKAIS